MSPALQIHQRLKSFPQSVFLIQYAVLQPLAAYFFLSTLCPNPARLSRLHPISLTTKYLRDQVIIMAKIFYLCIDQKWSAIVNIIHLVSEENKTHTRCVFSETKRNNSPAIRRQEEEEQVWSHHTLLHRIKC